MDIKLHQRLIKKFNKKAVLFSLISVLFSVLFITIFSQNFSTLYEDRIPGSNIRINVLDVYVRNFETYIGDSARISTFRTLDALTTYSNNRHQFFNNSTDFDQAFSDCMIYNRVNGVDCGLGQYSLTARLDDIANLSNSELNIKTVYKINSVSIEQDFAFEVEIKVNISYNITDNSDENYYAKWTKEIVITQPVSIIGLQEPTGNINDSTNRYNRTIKRYDGNCKTNTSIECWTPANIIQFYQDQSFRLQPNSTSFLQRYWNDKTPSDKLGIETILHPSELPLPLNLNHSYTEQHYWDAAYTCNNSTISIGIYSITGDNVSLDHNTAIIYGLSNSSIKTICGT